MRCPSNCMQNIPAMKYWQPLESILSSKKLFKRRRLKNKRKNIEILFVTLDKSFGAFSPTTNYADYAISEKIFHWQSQNYTRPKSGAGLSYIKYKREENKYYASAAKRQKISTK